MNKIVLLILSVLQLWGVEFHTYKEALLLQKQTGKIIMIDVVRTECHYCQKMDIVVFQDKKMSSYLKKNFIPVRINLDTDKLLQGMHVDFTPTFYFIDKKGKIVKRVIGSWNLEDFKFILEKIK